MHYAEGGNGDIPVVLIHGATLNSSFMSEIIPGLEDVAHIYACDLLGHGQSDWADNHYLITDYVEGISAFIRDVSGQGSVVVGFSIGGLVAIGAAARVPNLVIGVAALDPP
jgi:pimeloyl-ACP methyl ester carboxylesterase